MKTYGKIITWLSFSILLLTLIPLLWLGFYNHPTGDDYDYGVETHHVWQDTHNPAAVLQEAAKGVAVQYQIWQGTYSAMFLMYLPPNLFDESAYHLVTFVVLSLLLSGIFYLNHQFLRGLLGATRETWLCVSSLLSLLCIQTTPFASESYYWYNGSMYYTGYLGLSLLFLGLLCKLLTKPGFLPCLLSSLLAFFLAGGNYVSLLPTMLIAFAITGLVLLRDLKAGERRISYFLPACFALCGGFLISALAPGNKVRQSEMWKIPAIKAILKSLRQGGIFLLGWTSLLLVLTLFLITPILWEHYKKTQFTFRYPLLVLGFAYGVLCSTACPTFYTMNSTGPARAAAVMYYNFMIFIFFSYYYFLGYLHRLLGQKKPDLKNHVNRFFAKYLPLWSGIAVALFVFALLLGKCTTLNCTRALRSLTDGSAAAYEAQYQERLTILFDKTQRDVVLSPYETKADLIYVGDFTEDPAHPTNQRIAAYFDKNSLCVRQDTDSSNP